MRDFTTDDIERATGRPFNKAMSNAREWRFGGKGALSVSPDDGLWFDHESGEGGTVSALLGRQVAYRAPEAKRPPRHRKRWSPTAQKVWEGSK